MPALAALAAMPEVIVGIAVLLLIWATFYAFQKPIAGLLSQLPLVGGYVAGTVSNAIGGLVDWGIGVADSTIGAAIALVTYPVTALLDLAYGAASALEAVEAQIGRLSAAVGASFGTVWPRLLSVESTAVNALGKAVTGLAIASGAAALAQTLQSTTIPQARSDAVSTAHTYTNTAVGNERTYRREADAAEATARAGAVAAEAHYRQLVDANLAGDIAAETTARAQALEAQWGRTGVLVDGKVGPVASDVGDILTALGPLTITGLISRVVTLETDVTDTFRDCVNPTCEALGSGLDGVSSLTGVLALGALAGLVGAAIADPDGTAREVAGWRGVLTPGASALSQLLGGPAL